MKKIATIVGARPQFIKAAVVSRAIRKQEGLKEILIHTGQHYDANMSDIFFNELEIHEIDYQLGVGSGTQGKQTGEMLDKIEMILIKEKPDYVLIYGDTNSTLAAALAAAKLHIPIAHIEAGLRSYNRKMPEEVNRIVADQLSEILFTPTAQAVSNLINEGYAPDRIVEVGDVMYDAAIFFAQKAIEQSHILKNIGYQHREYILATIHRAENTDNLDKLATIFTALGRISKLLPIIMPLHPRTRKVLETHHPGLLKNSGINTIEPIGFLDMVMLEKNAALIITDSGGVQKEAFFYHVPCITLRDETEWLETVQLGWNTLIKPDNADNIFNQASKSLGSCGVSDQNPYGAGNAATHISQYLMQGKK